MGSFLRGVGSVVATCIELTVNILTYMYDANEKNFDNRYRQLSNEEKNTCNTKRLEEIREEKEKIEKIKTTFSSDETYDKLDELIDGLRR